MYPVSNAYIEKILSNSIRAEWFGTIRTNIGITYQLNGENIVQSSGKITRQICSGEDIEIGSTCSAGFDVQAFLDADRYTLHHATITLTYRLYLDEDGTYEDVPGGTFYVEDAPERTLSVVTLHAYDAMVKFNQAFGLTLQGTPYYMLNYACNACGVELGSTQDEIAAMTNGTVETYIYEGANVGTYRDLIGFVASYLCGYAYIGLDNKLYIRQYGMTPVRNITEDWRFEYTPCDYESYYTALTAYFMVTQETEYFTIVGDGLTYDLETNPLIQFNSDDIRKSVLNNILNQLTQIRYTPFKATIPCDPSLMPGDVLNFTGNHARDGKYSAITKQTITLGGGMEIECCGADPISGMKTEIQKKLETASENTNKDGMYYYDFVNSESIHLDDGETARIILFNYVTTKKTHIDFHGEIKMLVDTTEYISSDETTYTEYDGEVFVTYKMSGEEVTEYYPMDTFFDGTKLLHLLYTWWASGNVFGTFEVFIRCAGCSVDIETGNGRGYISGVGLVGEGAWDGNVYIQDEFELFGFDDKILKTMSDDVDTEQRTESENGFSQSITELNFFNRMIPFLSDAVNSVSHLHRFSVLYNDSEMAKVNIVTVDQTWIRNDMSNIGSVTTPICDVDRIVTITSRHSGNDAGYTVSFDGGSTWWIYSGGWVQAGSNDYMVEATMKSITTAQWAQKLNGTIMVKATLLYPETVLNDIQIFTEVIT